jgi:DNA-binding GntR family transcriptional regulator
MFDLERVRLLDGVAVALERSRLPLHFAPRLQADLALGSLYGRCAAGGYRPCRLSARAIPTGRARRQYSGQAAPLLIASARPSRIRQTNRNPGISAFAATAIASAPPA